MISYAVIMISYVHSMMPYVRDGSRPGRAATKPALGKTTRLISPGPTPMLLDANLRHQYALD